MSEKNNKIPVFFSADENYIPCLGVAIKSLEMNANPDVEYEITVLHDGISENGQQDIKTLETDNVKINFENLNKITKKIEKDLELRLRDYYSIAIYNRMFIPSLFPQYEKCVYLDSDTIVLKDIADFYNIDMGNNLLVAIKDAVANSSEDLKNYVQQHVGIEPDKYFNSGVLVMNLKEMRAQNIEEKFKYLLTKYNPETVAPDQDYLNILCKDRIKYVGEEWDKMPDFGERTPVENLNLIHYNMFRKPWHYADVPYSEDFWKYAKMTKYYDILQTELNNYSDEQKEKDLEKGALMTVNANRMIKESLHFTSIIDDVKMCSIN